MDRKLASIQIINNIKPIEGADKILTATVLGWQVVVTKSDNFKNGDLVVFFEIDSILPEKPEFEFLRSRKFRIKTAKFQKQIAQGLVMPITILPDGNWKEGEDVTTLLSVLKYDPEGDKEQKLLDEKLANSKNRMTIFFNRYSWFRQTFKFLQPKRYTWPSFIQKTDENRIQNIPNICDYYKDTEFIATEKLDGQSATYFLTKNPYKFLWWGEKYIFGVCSRNFQLKENNSNYWKIAKEQGLKNILLQMIGDYEFVIIQGEIIGEGIQGNKYKIKGLDFYAYNLISPLVRLPQRNMEEVLNHLGIKTVPVVYSYFRLFPTMQETVKMAVGKSKLYDGQREGIVVRNYEKNLSFKIINPEFLLKYEE